MKAKSLSGDEHDKQDAAIHIGCTSTEKKIWTSLWGKSLRGFSGKLREILNNQAKKELEK